MNLENIETITLSNIGYDRYSSLSVDADAEKIEDFTLLHNCVYLAREEIKKRAFIPSILKSQTITTVAGTQAYNLASDFDLPVSIKFRGSSEYPLDRVYSENLLSMLNGSKTSDSGTVSFYRIFGNSSDTPQILLYLIPADAGNYVDVEYKPVLTLLDTSTDEDIIMKKFFLTVIKFASGYAGRFLKKDDSMFNTFFNAGIMDIAQIDLDEKSADSNYKGIPGRVLRNRRKNRLTQ